MSEYRLRFCPECGQYKAEQFHAVKVDGKVVHRRCDSCETQENKQNTEETPKVIRPCI